jgi:tetratricopeptide (TPR) repeat protein
MLMNLLLLVLALSPVQAYNQGNKLYAQKDYAGAAQAYQEALRAGPNAAARYNLGNALFKAGHIGTAILAYRRARALDPRDRDIATNLDFARNYRVDKVQGAPGPFTRAMDAVFHRLSRREASPLAAVALLLAACCLGVWIVRRWTLFAIGAAALALAALFAFVTLQAWNGEIGENPAVVVASEVDALSGPSEDAKQILLLHDGTEVRIREQRGEYLLVQLPGGTGGWIHKDAVQRVY